MENGADFFMQVSEGFNSQASIKATIIAAVSCVFILVALIMGLIFEDKKNEDPYYDE